MNTEKEASIDVVFDVFFVFFKEVDLREEVGYTPLQIVIAFLLFVVDFGFDVFFLCDLQISNFNTLTAKYLAQAS